MANVGVHSYMTTKASPTSSKLLYSVALWLCNNRVFFSHMKMIVSLGDGDTYYFAFHGSVTVA